MGLGNKDADPLHKTLWNTGATSEVNLGFPGEAVMKLKGTVRGIDLAALLCKSACLHLSGWRWLLHVSGWLCALARSSHVSRWWRWRP